MKIAIIGVGAIGGFVGARLAHAGDPFRMPLRELRDCLGEALRELEHDESFHPRIAQNQIEVVCRTRAVDPLRCVVLRDSTAQHDARALASRASTASRISPPTLSK